MFDVAAIARDLQRVYGIAQGTGPLRATPATLEPLIEQLRVFTDELVDAPKWQLGGNLEGFELRLQDWRDRLGDYWLASRAAIEAGQGESTDAVLWSVTSPLLLGLVGGPDSDAPQRPMDAVTPYSLANQLEVGVDAQNARHRQLVADLEQAYADAFDDVVDAAKGGIGIAGVIAGVAVGAVIWDAWRSRKRRRPRR